MFCSNLVEMMFGYRNMDGT